MPQRRAPQLSLQAGLHVPSHRRYRRHLRLHSCKLRASALRPAACRPCAAGCRQRGVGHDLAINGWQAAGCLRGAGAAAGRFQSQS